jgi:hypothetical protein
MVGVKYRPGSRAPRTGAYTVNHRTHRLSHIVLVDEGTFFPECRKCGDDVRYELYMRIQHLESDRDFSDTPQEHQGEKEQKANVLPFRHPRVG